MCGKTSVEAHLRVVPLDCFKNWKSQTVRLRAGFTLCREGRQIGVFGRGDWFHQCRKFPSKKLLEAERVFWRNIPFLLYFYTLSQASTYGHSWRQDSEPDGLTHCRFFARIFLGLSISREMWSLCHSCGHRWSKATRATWDLQRSENIYLHNYFFCWFEGVKHHMG